MADSLEDEIKRIDGAIAEEIKISTGRCPNPGTWFSTPNEKLEELKQRRAELFAKLNGID